MVTEAERLVSVVYALADQQLIVEVHFEQGMTAAVAVERSGLDERFPEIRSAPLVLGVWGEPVPSNLPLQPGDRVEISRPLRADPRDMRRDLITSGRVMGGADAPPNRLRRPARE